MRLLAPGLVLVALGLGVVLLPFAGLILGGGGDVEAHEADADRLFLIGGVTVVVGAVVVLAGTVALVLDEVRGSRRGGARRRV